MRYRRKYQHFALEIPPETRFTAVWNQGTQHPGHLNALGALGVLEHPVVKQPPPSPPCTEGPEYPVPLKTAVGALGATVHL